MFSFELNRSLDEIATGENHSDAVFQVITWAEAQGKLQELIDAASECNPGNSQLREFCQEWSQWQLPQEPVLITSPQIEEDDFSSETRISQPAQEQPQPTPRTPPQIEDNLPSEKGVDYTRLENLLKAEKWKEADEETLEVMLKVAGREKEGWLDYESIDNFPCADLRTIDQLWVKYSNGRFGFSLQKRIWESVGEDYEKFGDRVGWRKKDNKEWLYYKKLTFSLEAPQGHLPVSVRGGSRVGWDLWDMLGWGYLLSRRDLYNVTYKAYRVLLKFINEPFSTKSCGFWVTDTWHCGFCGFCVFFVFRCSISPAIFWL